MVPLAPVCDSGQLFLSSKSMHDLPGGHVTCAEQVWEQIGRDGLVGKMRRLPFDQEATIQHRLRNSKNEILQP